MSRRITQTYACPALQSLARQLLFAPPAQRRDQVGRAEVLHDQINPEQDYPYEFIAYRITSRRVGDTVDHPDLDHPLKGAQILPDLRLLIDTLSRSIDIAVEPEEAVESAAELSKRLNVSEKTVSRWRREGLRWRWVVDAPGGQRRLVFPAAAVVRFLESNAARVERAARFTRMTNEESDALLARARRLAEAGEVSLNQVATHLARRTGRAIETVRRLLEQHDRECEAIFVDYTGPLTAKQRRVISRAYRLGISVSKMARRYKRTRATIYRAIHERRAADLRQRQIEVVESPTFSRPDAREVILGPHAPASSSAADHALHRPEPHRPEQDLAGLPEPLRPLFLHPPLDHDLQRSLLVRFNYLKFRAAAMRDGLDRFSPRAAELDEIESLLARADRIADRMILASLPAALSLALRHLIDQAERSPARLLELLDQSQEVLPRAIETFDASRGQTFEAHLTWLLLRRFASRQADKPRAARRAEPDATAMLPRFRAAARNAGDGQDAATL
ncbi:MAG: hypothetical protein NTW19_18080 [Planctomycetota bacterium]|nr:hypothetical protein [Planctomycetota bacterium]